MSQTSDKKIRYVSIDPSAILLDQQFVSLNLQQRGMYFSILLYLFVNNGSIGKDFNALAKAIGYTGNQFEKSFKSISSLFTVRSNCITSPLVSKAIARAVELSSNQSAKGISSAKARGYKIEQPKPVEPGEAKRREDKISEVKRSDSKESVQRLIQTSSDSTKDSSSLGSAVRDFQSHFSPRLESQKTGTNSSPEQSRRAEINPAILSIRLFDDLCAVFKKRTPADTSSLHNLVRWVQKSISEGRFNNDIAQRIVDAARDSCTGRSRKPIAVFYSNIKNDLGYRNYAD